MIARLVFLAFLLAAFSPVLAAPATAPKPKIIEKSMTFESGGKKVRAVRIAPDDQQKHAAIVLLHGAGGGNPASLSAIGRQLADQGYAAFVIYYMDRTGHHAADAQTIQTNFLDWLSAVQDAVTFIGKQDGIDAKRIGLLGFSLGGYLSLSAGAAKPESIAAIVEYFGGMPDPLALTVKTMPATLILHGEADKIVPITEARKVEKLLKEHDVTFEIKTYPNVGHNFANLSTPEAKDANQRTAAFFKKYLKPESK